MLSGSEMIARSLIDEGVEYIFGYPGGAVLHIYDALFNVKEIPHILVRHEQAAAHAADGYARSTGKPGVVLVTSGPGATNAITGIATAYMDSIPMVILSGQVHSHLIGGDAFQETDMVGITRPIVKHSFLVQRTEDIPKIIKKAFYIATSGRPGPVVIDIPKDLTAPDRKFKYSYPGDIQLRSYNPPSRGHTGQIKKAVTALINAERPVIYCGGGVVQGEASEQLQALVNELAYPVTCTLMALGAYPANGEHYIGMLGMHGTYEANHAMHNSDLILAVGARFDDRVTNTINKFCPQAKIIHIDIDPASISKIITADYPIVGHVKPVLEEMLKMVREEKRQHVNLPDKQKLAEWWSQINEWKRDYGLWTSPRYDTGSGLIKPQEVINSLSRLTEGNAFITSDVGQHQMFAAQYYRFNKPRRWINSGGLGTMGFGLPAAMGVKLAHPDVDVACVTGEGSIQMNIQELSTCTQYQIPVKIINLNNGYLGLVKQQQDMNYESRYSHSTYEESLPDFVKLADAYDHMGIKVTRPGDLDDAIAEAFKHKDRLVFLDIHVDPDEHVYPMQVAPPEGSMRDMWLSKTERS